MGKTVQNPITVEPLSTTFERHYQTDTYVYY